MSRTARLLELLITLETKPQFTVGELAAEFGVSRRTMLRDLHALSEMGVPLAAAPGPHGGYRLIRDRRLLPLSVSPDEAIALLLSYESFLQYTESPFAVQSLSAVTKLRNALPSEVVRELDRVRDRVVMAEVVRSAEAPLLADVLRAALDGVHLDIVYDSRSGVSTRRIFPHGLYASHGLWYCVCFDHRRGRALPLRVDRIRSLERVEGLDPPEPTTVRDWLRTYGTDAPDLLPFRARLTRRGARTPEMETLFGAIPLGEDGEGRVEGTIPTAEIEYFARQLLALGADAVVEEPRELVAAIREQAAAVSALYERTEPLHQDGA